MLLSEETYEFTAEKMLLIFKLYTLWNRSPEKGLVFVLFFWYISTVKIWDLKGFIKVNAAVFSVKGKKRKETGRENACW